MSEQWLKSSEKPQPTVKIPLQFHFQPVEILSKQLTKLNSPYSYRIHYLGPRWQDSSILHKKYANKQGYKFNDKEINKNSNFFSEVMCQNQFYRSQVYYRAFQGMNPTIDREEELEFNSRFQSGNLDCVVKVAPDQYDLFLRVDSNTRGHLFWFYFEISNGKPETVVKLNLCNMTKSIQLYEKGFRPYSSLRNSHGEFKNWSQESCFEICVGPKKLRYQFIYEKIKGRKLYQLSFKYKFQSKEPVRFAYCVPYTYSEMLCDIKRIQSLKVQNLQVGSIGKSLLGVDIPFIMVGKDDQPKTQQKNVLICIARLHPGQTNGSHVLSGLINHICTSNEAEYIRKKIITIFIPMLNPDGVILGNSRTGAIGKDLNREFKTRNKSLFPQVFNLKKFCNKVLETHDIEMFLDFHGHSRKKNMFAFGPNYNITQPEYYRSRMLPKFISQLTPIFRYFGCDYSLPMSKSTTARAVMLQELSIPYVYAIQTSIGQYFDYESHKILGFGLRKWSELGAQTGRALRMYFQSVQQFADYCRLRVSDVEQSKGSTSPVKTSKIPPLKNASIQKPKKIITNQKDVKLLKIFEEIKVSEQERKISKKRLQESDNQSDSENQQDNLEGKKRAQFEGMIAECIQVQKKRKQRQAEWQDPKPLKSKKQPTQIPRKRQKNKDLLREALKLQTPQFSHPNPPPPSLQPQSQPQNITYRSFDKRINRSEQCSNRYSSSQRDSDLIGGGNKMTRAQYEEIITQHIYFDDVLPENTAEKGRRNNLNLRMFNFSKVIEETQGRNAASSGRKGRNRYLASLREVNTLDSQTGLKAQTSQLSQMNSTLNRISLEQNLRIHDYDNDSPQKQQPSTGTASRKMKGLYPASFYRIKYQNYQKKKKQRYIEEFREDNRIIDQDIRIIESQRKREGLFLNIRKFDHGK